MTYTKPELVALTFALGAIECGRDPIVVEGMHGWEPISAYKANE